jgi:hypothetical protein
MAKTAFPATIRVVRLSPTLLSKSEIGAAAPQIPTPVPDTNGPGFRLSASGFRIQPLSDLSSAMRFASGRAIKAGLYLLFAICHVFRRAASFADRSIN